MAIGNTKKFKVSGLKFRVSYKTLNKQLVNTHNFTLEAADLKYDSDLYINNHLCNPPTIFFFDFELMLRNTLNIGT